MAKATHRGTCQVCGRVQAVNAKTGMLAKHGYTVEWGWFEGTCRGSDHLPFEKSCELVKESIVWAEERLVYLAKKIEETKEWTLDSEVKARVYLGYNEARKGGYYTVSAKIVKDEKWHSWGLEFSFGGRDFRKENKECLTGATAERLLAALIERHVDLINRQVREVTHYKEVQQNRVDTWAEADLMEIKR